MFSIKDDYFSGSHYLGYIQSHWEEEYCYITSSLAYPIGQFEFFLKKIIKLKKNLST